MKPSLKERMTIAERKFDDLTKQKREIEEELLRLQGEYRIMDDISKQQAQDPATIVVKPKKGKK